MTNLLYIDLFCGAGGTSTGVNTTMLFKCEGITIGKGNPAWGAPEEDVFIIKLGERIVTPDLLNGKEND